MQLTDDRPTRVNRYSAPPFFPVPALLLVLIPFQLFVHFSSHSIAAYVKDTVEGLLGKGFVAASFKFLLGAHGAEASYMLSQCIKYHCPADVGAKYVVTTLLFGFVGIQQFNRQARIAEKGKSKSL